MALDQQDFKNVREYHTVKLAFYVRQEDGTYLETKLAIAIPKIGELGQSVHGKIVSISAPRPLSSDVAFDTLN